MRSFFLHVFAFCYRNYLFARRNVFVLVEMLFWPVLGILSIGLMGSFLQFGSNTLGFVLTGAIAAGVLQVAQLDVGYSLLYDIWSKSLKHTFLTPAGIPSALAGAWIVGILRGTIIYALLAVLAKIFFDFPVPPVLPMILFLAGIFWMALLSGIAVWILMLNYGQRAEISVWALSYLVMILCGIYYPVNYLPGPLYAVAQFVPLTYFLDGIRSQYGFQPLFADWLLRGWALNFIYTAVGLGLAQLALNKAHRTGLLVRMSE
jgi:ABC-2 type transport system permease protein